MKALLAERTTSVIQVLQGAAPVWYLSVVEVVFDSSRETVYTTQSSTLVFRKTITLKKPASRITSHSVW